MTTQANAYYANKLKERELEEVKIPELGLKTRQFSEIEKPKVAISAFEAQEKARSNKANEGLKAQEIAETQRYNLAREGLTSRELDIKQDTSLTRDEQFEKQMLSDYGRIYSKGDYKNLYGSLNAANYTKLARQFGSGGYIDSYIGPSDTTQGSNKPTTSGTSLVDSSRSDAANLFLIGYGNRAVKDKSKKGNDMYSKLREGLKGAVSFGSYATSLNE